MSKHILVLVACLSSPSAFGGLMIDSSSPTGLAWDDPASDPSPIISIRVENPSNITDPVAGLTATIQVTGQGGSTGVVEVDEIVSSEFPLFFTEPAGPNATRGVALVFPPLVVPATGVDFADVSFVASPDASGQFDVELVPFTPPDLGTFWMNDAFPPTAFAFDNTDTSQLLGTIAIGSVDVPETSSILTWMILTSLALCYVRF